VTLVVLIELVGPVNKVDPVGSDGDDHDDGLQSLEDERSIEVDTTEGNETDDNHGDSFEVVKRVACIGVLLVVDDVEAPDDVDVEVDLEERNEESSENANGDEAVLSEHLDKFPVGEFVLVADVQETEGGHGLFFVESVLVLLQHREGDVRKDDDPQDQERKGESEDPTVVVSLPALDVKIVSHVVNLFIVSVQVLAEEHLQVDLNDDRLEVEQDDQDGGTDGVLEVSG